jgi:hypothetical protein
LSATLFSIFLRQTLKLIVQPKLGLVEVVRLRLHGCYRSYKVKFGITGAFKGPNGVERAKSGQRQKTAWPRRDHNPPTPGPMELPLQLETA